MVAALTTSSTKSKRHDRCRQQQQLVPRGAFLPRSSVLEEAPKTRRMNKSKTSQGPPRQTSAQRELARRAHLLHRFERLVANGASKEEAAKKVRVSQATLWRWRQRLNEGGREALAPQTHKCGRNSAAELLPITPQIIDTVQRLAFVRKSPDAAWREYAERPDCPSEIADYIRSVKTLPPSLRDLARLHKTVMVQYEGQSFTASVPLKEGNAAED